jgi:hypothetical protein
MGTLIKRRMRRIGKEVKLKKPEAWSIAFEVGFHGLLER